MDDSMERTRELIHGGISDHANECAREGAVCAVWEEIGKMREHIGAIEKSLAEDRGAAREAAAKNVRTVQILAGLSALATVIGFILNHWPHR